MAASPDLSTLGRRLAFARQSRGLSKRGLAIAAGLKSKAHVGMIERDDVASPAVETAAKLAAALGISLEWLVTGDNDMNLPAKAANGDG